MSVSISQAAEYIEAIGNMAVGSALIFEDVTWDEYEELLDEFSDNSHYRISYAMTMKDHRRTSAADQRIFLALTRT